MPLGSLLTHLDPAAIETPAVFRRVTEASRQLAEFKGVVRAIPNGRVLLAALALEEAKDSSAIENIVTTHDELYKSAAGPDGTPNPAALDVLRNREALDLGSELVRAHGLITNNHILRIQAVLEPNKPGFRKVPGTSLRDQAGRVIYTPPQDAAEVGALMHALESELNAPVASGLDPLVRMAVLHHQFESIHPFYDGNGRTGRILNVLYLLKEGLLDLPVLQLSRRIVRSREEYYRLLQAVRDDGAWEAWVLYMLAVVAESAREGILLVNAIGEALRATGQEVRSRLPKIYSQDLVNNLFAWPYTKIQFVEQDVGVSRPTATRYLEQLTTAGILEKTRSGRTSYYMNVRLVRILTEPTMTPATELA